MLFVLAAGAFSTLPASAEGSALAPHSCVAAFFGGSVDLSWDVSVGAVEYVVYRSVSGSPEYWRGKTSDVVFVDSNRSGVLVYKVRARGDDGALSEKTTCGDGAQPGLNANFVAAGDFSRCETTFDSDVGNLLDRLPQADIIGLGDYAYPDGTDNQLINCFDPALGRHKARFIPAVGNHEFDPGDASLYFSYFGESAGLHSEGWHSQTSGDWQIITLNTNCTLVACDVGSPQYSWLQSELASAPSDSCRAIVMHHPRWSSWSLYGGADVLDPLTQLFGSYNIDLLLTGHSHHYERLSKMDADRVASALGFRQFTVGTGGATLRAPLAGDILPESESLIADSYGVLTLSLSTDGYDWEFVTTGNLILDSGSDTCNN